MQLKRTSPEQTISNITSWTLALKFQIETQQSPVQWEFPSLLGDDNCLNYHWNLLHSNVSIQFCLQSLILGNTRTQIYNLTANKLSKLCSLQQPRAAPDTQYQNPQLIILTHKTWHNLSQILAQFICPIYAIKESTVFINNSSYWTTIIHS